MNQEAKEKWIRWCLFCPDTEVRAKAYSALTHLIVLKSGRQLTNRFDAFMRFDTLLAELKAYFGVAENHTF